MFRALLDPCRMTKRGKRLLKNWGKSEVPVIFHSMRPFAFRGQGRHDFYFLQGHSETAWNSSTCTRTGGMLKAPMCFPRADSLVQVGSGANRYSRGVEQSHLPHPVFDLYGGVQSARLGTLKEESSFRTILACPAPYRGGWLWPVIGSFGSRCHRAFEWRALTRLRMAVVRGKVVRDGMQ